MSDEKKGHSSESGNSRREQSGREMYRAMREELDRLRKGRPKVKLPEEEQAWRWRHLMRHRRFLDDV
jgi:hypothetical protein